jgi:hypothetical protein
MSVVLTFFATLVFIALWPVCGGIYNIGPRSDLVARWALALWVLTFDAALFAAALQTGGYLRFECVVR